MLDPGFIGCVIAFILMSNLFMVAQILLASKCGALATSVTSGAKDLVSTVLGFIIFTASTDPLFLTGIGINACGIIM